MALIAYSAFALNVLPIASLSEILGGMKDLASCININLLSEALIRESSSTSFFAVPAHLRLWLLAQFISIHRLQEGISQEPVYIRALSVLLSNSASEIVGRIDAEDADGLPQSSEEDDDGQNFATPLPQFVKEELVTLVDKRSIKGLLSKFNT